MYKYGDTDIAVYGTQQYFQFKEIYLIDVFFWQQLKIVSQQEKC